MTPLEEFASFAGGDRVFWRAPGTDAVVGLGADRAVDVDGGWRFESAAAAAAEILNDGQVAFAGFGFADRPGTGPWAGYPSGRLGGAGAACSRVAAGIRRLGRSWSFAG